MREMAVRQALGNCQNPRISGPKRRTARLRSRKRAADAVRRVGALGLKAKRLALRGLVVRRRGAVAMLPHERVELFLVLGVAQAAEEILELLLFLLEAAQRLTAILVEGTVAAGGRAEAEPAEAMTLH